MYFNPLLMSPLLMMERIMEAKPAMTPMLRRENVLKSLGSMDTEENLIGMDDEALVDAPSFDANPLTMVNS